MKKAALPLLFAVGLHAAPAASGDTFINTQPLFRDVVTGTAGVETIVPVFVMRDTNNDNRPDVLYVKFRVYQGGTTTLLNESAFRGVFFPDNPCTNASWVDVDMDPHLLGNASSTRGTVVVALTTSCQETGSGNYKDAFRTFVYSANLASADNSPWTHVQNREVISAEGIDTMGGDGVNELILSTIYNPDPNIENAANLIVTKLNFATGAILNQAIYPIVRP